METLLICIGSLAYGFCGLICARLIAGHFAYQLAYNAWTYDKRYYPSLSRHLKSPEPPDGFQWFWGGILGLLVGVIWPVAWALSKVSFSKLAIGAEAKDIRRRQDERIKELEKALDA